MSFPLATDKIIPVIIIYTPGLETPDDDIE